MQQVEDSAEIRISLPGKPTIVITGFTKEEVEEILPRLQAEFAKTFCKEEKQIS